MPVRIEGLVIDGPQLEAVPWDDRKAKVAVRIVNVYPHGTAFRYDIEYYGLEPGEYDLRKYLRRKDGSSADTLPAIPVKVSSTLPSGHIPPRELEPTRLPWIGGYRLVAYALGALWLLGLVLLLRRRRRPTATAEPKTKTESLADRLRPIVESAIEGKLEPGQRAELERLLLCYWRHRLDLDDVKPAEAVARLRQHDEAGRLLRALEGWLHRPDPPQDVDVAALLEPYRDLPAEDEPAHSVERARTTGHDHHIDAATRLFAESHTTS
jgi:hypothetical protein